MPLRVAIVSDYLEEGWPSMDLVADMLVRELAARSREGRECLAVSLMRPRFVARLTRVGGAGANRHLFNADRILNRFVDYPRFLRARRNEFDLFHIVDHSYSHLVPVAGPQRAVVTCHDLDTFRSIIEPDSETRSRFYTAMARRILAGFRMAAAIACVSAATRDQVLRHRLAPAERLTVNHNGVADTFNPRSDAGADREARRLLGTPDAGTIELLHVGSTIARKRIDVAAPGLRGAPARDLRRPAGPGGRRFHVAATSVDEPTWPDRRLRADPAVSERRGAGGGVSTRGANGAALGVRGVRPAGAGSAGLGHPGSVERDPGLAGNRRAGGNVRGRSATLTDGPARSSTCSGSVANARADGRRG